MAPAAIAAIEPSMSPIKLQCIRTVIDNSRAIEVKAADQTVLKKLGFTDRSTMPSTRIKAWRNYCFTAGRSERAWRLPH
jgi:hypothetical protein